MSPRAAGERESGAGRGVRIRLKVLTRRRAKAKMQASIHELTDRCKLPAQLETTTDGRLEHVRDRRRRRPDYLLMISCVTGSISSKFTK